MVRGRITTEQMIAPRLIEGVIKSNTSIEADTIISIPIVIRVKHIPSSEPFFSPLSNCQSFSTPVCLYNKPGTRNRETLTMRKIDWMRIMEN